ncbi:MAG: ABC transporter ATP-binding protein [Rickettsiales bacterium]|nr:MAG: ABC transporter ATP-binding protein [Rickettsiales bacterium]
MYLVYFLINTGQYNFTNLSCVVNKFISYRLKFLVMLKRSDLLIVDDISKSYKNGIFAIKNISFSAKGGELIGLIGKNGAGKTSLIHSIMGLIRSNSGKVIINSDVEKRIAWVSQKLSIDWYLTVFDNIYLGPRLQGFSCKESHDLTLYYSKILDIENLLELTPDHLSGGQVQRVQVARALSQKPDILILDEPSVGLDMQNTEKVFSILKQKSKENCLVIISSHDLDMLEKYIDRVLYLQNGILMVDSSIDQFISSNNNDLIHITYSGTIDDLTCKSIKENCIEFKSIDPLIFVIDHKKNIQEFLDILFNKINIKNISRSRDNLKEIFLKL